MKNKITSVIVILLLIMVAIFGVTCCFTKGAISNHIYAPQNVYEEIWNMLASEERGGETLLTTGSEDANVDWDFGIEFVGVYIPACNAGLHWHWSTDEDAMTIYLRDGEDRYQFIYVYDTKMLYGDAEEAYLIEHFLTDYFQWYEVTSHLSSKFSLDDLGEYYFHHSDPAYNYH